MTYRILIAMDVPHYRAVHVEAATKDDAIALVEADMAENGLSSQWWNEDRTPGFEWEADWSGIDPESLRVCCSLGPLVVTS